MISPVGPYNIVPSIVVQVPAEGVLNVRESARDLLKPVPHRHVVCSVPKRLRWAFKRERSRLNILFEATEETLRELLVEACGEGRLGLILTAQTAGEALNWNPHCHGLLASGLFTIDGSFIPVSDFSAEKATKLFAHKVLSKMRQAGLIEQSTVDQIMAQRHTGFSVWFGDSILPEDQATLHFVAQYIDRGPVERKRLEIVDDLVTYETDRETWEGTMLEFLARLSIHLPSRYESVSRAYGEYSSRVRGEQAKQQRANRSQPLSILEEPDRKNISKKWASLIKKVYDIDAAQCEKCGGRMKIKSFVTDPPEVSRILKHRGVPEFRAPPPIPRPFVDPLLHVA